jgi:hypothetical protein
VKSKEIEILIKHRLEQAQHALDDAKYLLIWQKAAHFVKAVQHYFSREIDHSE